MRGELSRVGRGVKSKKEGELCRGGREGELSRGWRGVK